jgi:hypothetical protein
MPNQFFAISNAAGSIAQQAAAVNQAYKEYQEVYGLTKKDPSSSQMTYTLQIPEDLLTTSLESIDRELEERASALSEIAKLLEVVEETDSLIRHHISTLRRAANQSERKKSKKTQSYQPQPAPMPAGVAEIHFANSLVAGAGGGLDWPGPSLPGQG